MSSFKEKSVLVLGGSRESAQLLSGALSLMVPR